MLSSIAVCSITGLAYENMEIAPTMFGEWSDLFAGAYHPEKPPVALQSVFFKTVHNLYSDRRGWIAHLSAVASFSKSIGCAYLVIGSPAARFAPSGIIRQRPGVGEMAEADMELASALSEVATENPDVYFGLEANPIQYGANVAVNAHEALEIVRFVNLPNVVFHIDTGCLRLAGDDPLLVLGSSSANIKRCHVSIPDLLPYDGSEGDFISMAIRLGIGISYEARASSSGEAGLDRFIKDVERARLLSR
jgi:sugar phosphate isomerase/epimerase